VLIIAAQAWWLYMDEFGKLTDFDLGYFYISPQKGIFQRYSLFFAH
jgi:hypothetical protein